MRRATVGNAITTASGSDNASPSRNPTSVSVSVIKLLYKSSGAQALAVRTISVGTARIQFGIWKKRALSSQSATNATYIVGVVAWVKNILQRVVAIPSALFRI